MQCKKIHEYTQYLLFRLWNKTYALICGFETENWETWLSKKPLGDWLNSLVTVKPVTRELSAALTIYNIYSLMVAYILRIQLMADSIQN